MNKLSLTPKTSSIIPLYVHQHNSEHKISFPWVISSVFHAKKYAKVDSIFMKYTALLKSDDFGKISISILDTRKQFTNSNKVVEIELRSDLDTEISIGNLEWADRYSPSPYILKIHLDLRGIRPDTKIGEIKMEPSFKYTDQQPELQRLSLLLMPQIPDQSRSLYNITIESDEQMKKYIKGTISKQTKPESIIRRQSSVSRGRLSI
ncbi:putative cell-to-cell movement protein [rudbeckia virus 1]|uniref:Cell-to-cell movement protein n=1 Tax=rudbeckia virus 1 TaxID=2971904 RepID=A0AAX3C944_9RHAB|nr:putative cell-to-cell movement protein [rudbeckia virus 1]